MVLSGARRRRARLALGAVAAVLLVAAVEPRPAMVFQASPESPNFGSLEVQGLPAAALSRLASLELDSAGWRALLSVRMLTAGGGEAPAAVLGRYAITAGVLRFTPRFPLGAGLDFRGRFDGELFDVLTGPAAEPTPALEIELTMPEPEEGPSTRVLAVFPSATDLPENLLRLYVHFSAPMRPRSALHGIRLVDAAGLEVPGAFVEVDQGLWTPDRRRLTLLVHPGRVKRGVGPQAALGPVLEAGKSYRLVIDPRLEDARGFPLAEGREKALRAVAADRDSPDPEGWTLRPPRLPAGPLTVEFPEPLDHGLLLRSLSVLDVDGRETEGNISVSRQERRWTFEPASPWRRGRHLLRVGHELEDLAGNAVGRLFEAEPGLLEPGKAGADREIDLAFEPIP